ncbi:MAG TPA: PEP-CTERM sorting domain-containing protein [Sedimenticola thiotaurini]|uniref:PEP-CTERM sorting domain-containing protein n=1 Tax=Sedimenticola thiotaurini TaxID=1543721 RepID=A0A831RJR7_9GAMM|nr:PEP-CTERM sorting domain-containing protein [Sedimenticola thiotaurini]
MLYMSLRGEMEDSFPNRSLRWIDSTLPAANAAIRGIVMAFRALCSRIGLAGAVFVSAVSATHAGTVTVNGWTELKWDTFTVRYSSEYPWSEYHTGAWASAKYWSNPAGDPQTAPPPGVDNPALTDSWGSVSVDAPIPAQAVRGRGSGTPDLLRTEGHVTVSGRNVAGIAGGRVVRSGIVTLPPLEDDGFYTISVSLDYSIHLDMSTTEKNDYAFGFSEFDFYMIPLAADWEVPEDDPLWWVPKLVDESDDTREPDLPPILTKSEVVSESLDVPGSWSRDISGTIRLNGTYQGNQRLGFVADAATHVRGETPIPEPPVLWLFLLGAGVGMAFLLRGKQGRHRQNGKPGR